MIPDDLIINESNFNEYFFDVRRSKPQKGQVIACYTAIAEFVGGPEKQQIIDLLKGTKKAEAISQVMRKLLGASELDAYRVPRMMAEDLADGLTEQQVLDKIYKFKFETYYYTWPECVPQNDPHWSIISILNTGMLTKERVSEQDGLTIKAKLVMSEREEPCTTENLST
jgi:hypothetical protein